MNANGKYFDPFATRGPVRHTGENGDDTAGLEPASPPKFILAPPIEEETPQGYTFFYSPASADIIMDRLHSVCKQLSGKVKSKGYFHLKAILPLEVNKVGG